MKFSMTITGALVAALSISTPAFAELQEADFSCPLMSYNEKDLADLAAKIATADPDLPEAMETRLNESAAACQEQYGWTGEQTQKILQFDASKIVAIYFGDAMEKSGFDLAAFDALVDAADTEKLRAMIGVDGKEPAMDDAIALLLKAKGNDVSKELAGAVGGYMSGSAQAKLYRQELLAGK
jgi:hypothetical protein